MLVTARLAEQLATAAALILRLHSILDSARCCCLLCYAAHRLPKRVAFPAPVSGIHFCKGVGMVPGIGWRACLAYYAGVVRIRRLVRVVPTTRATSAQWWNCCTTGHVGAAGPWLGAKPSYNAQCLRGQKPGIPLRPRPSVAITLSCALGLEHMCGGVKRMCGFCVMSVVLTIPLCPTDRLGAKLDIWGGARACR